jgi:hypothetical protein
MKAGPATRLPIRAGFEWAVELPVGSMGKLSLGECSHKPKGISTRVFEPQQGSVATTRGTIGGGGDCR